MSSRVRNTSFSNCVSFSLRNQICFLSRWNFQLGPYINSISIEPILWAKPGSHMSCVPAPSMVSMLNTKWQMKASGSFCLFSLCFPPCRKPTSGGSRGTRLQAALLHSWRVPCDRWALRRRAEDFFHIRNMFRDENNTCTAHFKVDQRGFSSASPTSADQKVFIGFSSSPVRRTLSGVGLIRKHRGWDSHSNLKTRNFWSSSMCWTSGCFMLSRQTVQPHSR